MDLVVVTYCCVDYLRESQDDSVIKEALEKVGSEVRVEVYMLQGVDLKDYSKEIETKLHDEEASIIPLCMY